MTQPIVHDGAAGFMSRLRAQLPALAPSDAKVAQYILDSPQQVIFQSVSEVGQSAGTASSTVVRCAQQLGFKGFQDLKISLAREIGSQQSALRASIAAKTPPSEILDHVAAISADTVRAAARVVDPKQFTAVARALSKARRVLVVGIGTSAPIVQDAVFRLLTMGIRAEGPTEIYAQQMSAHSLEKGDLLIAVSHTGSTRETVACAQRARETGATTVALTSFSWSPLVEVVDFALVAGASKVTMEMEAMASRLAHIAVMDALLVAVAVKCPERTARHLEIYEEILAEHRF